MCIYSKTLTSFVQTIVKNVSVLGSGLSAVAYIILLWVTGLHSAGNGIKRWASWARSNNWAAALSCGSSAAFTSFFTLVSEPSPATITLKEKKVCARHQKFWYTHSIGLSHPQPLRTSVCVWLRLPAFPCACRSCSLVEFSFGNGTSNCLATLSCAKRVASFCAAGTWAQVGSGTEVHPSLITHLSVYNEKKWTRCAQQVYYSLLAMINSIVSTCWKLKIQVCRLPYQQSTFFLTRLSSAEKQSPCHDRPLSRLHKAALFAEAKG